MMNPYSFFNNKKSISCLSLCVFILFKTLPSIGQTDSLIIRDIKIRPDVKSNHISGVGINLNTELKYSGHKDKSPTSLIVIIKIYDKRGNGIKASFSGSKFNIDGEVGYKAENFPFKENFELFVPYYIMDISEGSHILTLGIKSLVKDTTITSPERHISISYTEKKEFSINKPGVKKFKAMIRGLRVANVDFKGRSWDYSRGSNPDIRYQIELRNDLFPDAVYVSPFMKNSLSAAWIDFSELIIISDGDRITFSVYDKDLVFDDLIGRKTFKLIELMEASDAGDEFYFGKVNYCLFDIQLIE